MGCFVCCTVALAALNFPSVVQDLGQQYVRKGSPAANKGPASADYTQIRVPRISAYLGYSGLVLFAVSCVVALLAGSGLAANTFYILTPVTAIYMSVSAFENKFAEHYARAGSSPTCAQRTRILDELQERAGDLVVLALSFEALLSGSLLLGKTGCHAGWLPLVVLHLAPEKMSSVALITHGFASAATYNPAIFLAAVLLHKHGTRKLLW